jgi:hypothetical protein
MTEPTKKNGNKNKHKIADDGVAKKADYTPEEQEVFDNYCIRLKNQPVKYKTTDKGLKLEGDMVLALAKVAEAFGTPDYDLQNFLLDQVARTFEGFQSSEGFCENDQMVKFCNSAMAILQGIKPQDEIEAMLAVQMIGVHNMAMEAMSLVMISDQYPESKDRNTNRATKLLRTFAAQMEALKKYRTGGQQKMIVEHVHVHEGGQAIVGNVNHEGGGVKNENRK